MFTLRSFGVFYLSLSLSAVPLLWARGMASLLTYAFSAYGLIVTITAAALWNIELFDLSKRPGGLIYIGIYVLVGTLTMVYLFRYGTGRVKSGEWQELQGALTKNQKTRFSAFCISDAEFIRRGAHE